MSCEIPDRVYAQYRNAPKALAWYGITPSIAAKICDASDDVQLMYDIDLNVGRQLDIIGTIVVINRSILADIILEVFECNGDGDFECGDTEVQCSETSVINDAQLSDEYFRTLLRSKIAKNNSDSTADDILTAVSLITPNTPWERLNDPGDMSFSLETYSALTDIERTLILTKDIIPKPQGVRFSGFLEGVGLAQCNSDGDFECGDTSVECVGFIGGS